MELHLNARYLSLPAFKSLDKLVRTYYNQTNSDGSYRWNPVNINEIDKTDLFYEPIVKFFRYCNTKTSSHQYDEIEVEYIKNVLYYSKGKSRLLDLFNSLLKIHDNLDIDYSYDYDFPKLFINLHSCPAEFNIGVLVNNLTEVFYYLLFFDEDTFRVLIETVNLIIDELVLEYIAKYNIKYRLYVPSDCDIDYTDNTLESLINS